jgi:hypothetical protein
MNDRRDEILFDTRTYSNTDRQHSNSMISFVNVSFILQQCVCLYQEQVDEREQNEHRILCVCAVTMRFSTLFFFFPKSVMRMS